MTRQECEDMLISLMETANMIYQSFNPKGNHLRMTCIDGQIGIIDAIKDENGVFLPHGDGGDTINAMKFPNGEVIRWDT